MIVKSVLQDWVGQLEVRMQGVLVSAVRGCDTAQRHDNSKVLQRVYRSEILQSHEDDLSKCKSFILAADIPTTVELMAKYLDDSDHMPIHYVMHFLHAAEILGYFLPDLERRGMWRSFYEVACGKYHLNPETQEALVARLTKEEEEFHKAQSVEVRAELYEANEVIRADSVKRLANIEKNKPADNLWGSYGGGT
jgi:hypothetical protein